MLVNSGWLPEWEFTALWLWSLQSAVAAAIRVPPLRRAQSQADSRGVVWGRSQSRRVGRNHV
jgi:hypothetical protein